MSKAHFRLRQRDLIPELALETEVTIIGAGAVGSFLALSLAKMGIQTIRVIDHDTVSEENVGAQIYGPGQIGKPKVDALQETLLQLASKEIIALNQKYEKGVFRGIVISAVDNMETRKLVWENHKGTSTIIIDPRMGAETALLYIMRPTKEKDAKSYVKSLYSDFDALPEPCTARSTAYTAFLLSGFVTKAVKNIITDQPYPRTAQWNIAGNELKAWVSE